MAISGDTSRVRALFHKPVACQMETDYPSMKVFQIAVRYMEPFKDDINYYYDWSVILVKGTCRNVVPDYHSIGEPAVSTY